MSSKIDELRMQLKNLIDQGDFLYFAMADSLNKLPKKIKTKLKNHNIKLPNIEQEYESWYSESLVLIKQLIPDGSVTSLSSTKTRNEKRLIF